MGTKSFASDKKTKSAQILIVLLGISLLSISFIQVVNYNIHITELNSSSAEIPFQRGMSYTSWGGNYNSSGVKQHFDDMNDLGIEYVAINHWWFQDYLNSTEIKMGPWSDSHANMTSLFEYAHSIGMKIMYKPMLNILKTYEWRSYIVFTSDWMGNYTEWMIDCAISAEAAGVEFLCIGCELGNMQVHSDEVREMIRQIREVYSGKLTYSANHDSFTNIDWWDAVDIIGTSMYTMMTIDYDPSVSELKTVWEGMYYELEELAIKFNKPICFTETGIEAKDGSNLIPNDNQISQTQDITEMENFYLSLFQSRLWKANWFKGAYWWIWDGQYPENNPDLNGFNPALIRDVIEEEYAKPHVLETPILPIFRSILPFFVSSVAFIFTVWKSKHSSLLKSYDLGKISSEQTGTHYYGIEEQIESSKFPIFFGLILGSLLAISLTDLLLLGHGLIQTIFTSTVILNLPIISLIGGYIIIFLLAIFSSLILIKRFSQYLTHIIFLVVLINPYLSLNQSGTTLGFFLKVYFDLLIALLLIGLLISLRNNKKEAHNSNAYLTIIFAAILIMGGYIALMAFFADLTQAFLCIPIGLIFAMIKENPNEKSVIEIDGKTIKKPETKIIAKRNNNIELKIQNIMPINALIAGMLMTFGNSVLNLVYMNYILVSIQYLPLFYVAPAICGAFFIIQKKSLGKTTFQNKKSELIKRIFNNQTLLLSGLVLNILGAIFILIGKPIIVWAILSAVYFILFLGTMIRTVLNSLSQEKKRKVAMMILIVLFMFILGFILNGVKGLLVYTVTFLMFKDGQIVIRDPSIDPVPQFDVVLTLDALILIIAAIIILISILYLFILKFYFRNQHSNNNVPIEES